MAQKNGTDRTVLLYLTMLLFFIFTGAVSAFSAESSVSGSEPEWASIATENAGLLSLPAEWQVISRDDAVERSSKSGMVFNVQQSLYAKPEGISSDVGASLQVFSVWGSDPSGRAVSLPPEILAQSGEDLIEGLVSGRYENVRQLNRGTLNADTVSVTTWGADSSNVRYKCATLFHGEKMVLILTRYLSGFETDWANRFGAIVGRWVSLRTLTPGPVPDLLMADAPLPDAVLPDANVVALPGDGIETVRVPDIPPAVPPQETPMEATPEIPEIVVASDISSDLLPVAAPVRSVNPAFILYGILTALVALAVLTPLVLLIKKGIRRRRARGRLSGFQDIVPVPITEEELESKAASYAIFSSGGSLAPEFFPSETPAEFIPEPEAPESETPESESDVPETIRGEDEDEDEDEDNRAAVADAGVLTEAWIEDETVTEPEVKFELEAEAEIEIEIIQTEADPEVGFRAETETETEITDAVPVRRGLGVMKFFSLLCRTFRAPGNKIDSEPIEEAPAEETHAATPEFAVEHQEDLSTVRVVDQHVEIDEIDDDPVSVAAEEPSPKEEKSDIIHPFDTILAEDMDFPPLSSTYDDPDHPSVWEEPSGIATTETLVEAAPEEAGFEKVYNLINEALDILESYKDVMPASRYYSNLPEDRTMPSISVLREKTGALVPPVKESTASTSSPASDAPNEVFDEIPLQGIAGSADSYGLKWLHLCAFVLVAMVDVIAHVLFTQAPSAELLLSQLRETVPTLLRDDFILMGASCIPALTVRFAILRRPISKGSLLPFVSALFVAFGVGAFSSGTLYFLSALPGINVMWGCALTAAFYLNYRTLTWRRAGDAEAEMEMEEDSSETNDADDYDTELPEEKAGMSVAEQAGQALPMPETAGEDISDDIRDDSTKDFSETSIHRSDEIFRELEAEFGTSYVLDLLEDKVLKVLENKEDMPWFLRSEDVSPDSLILKICDDALIDLMRTGRYHIGHGILSSEGQELLDLFCNIIRRLLQSGYGSPEELQKDSELMQRAVQEQG